MLGVRFSYWCCNAVHSGRLGPILGGASCLAPMALHTDTYTPVHRPTCICFKTYLSKVSGPGSVVGIATGYGLDGPGSNPGGGEIFRTCPDRPWDPPSLLYNGYRVFPWGKERTGRDADPSPTTSAVVMKG